MKRAAIALVGIAASKWTTAIYNRQEGVHQDPTNMKKVGRLLWTRLALVSRHNKSRTVRTDTNVRATAPLQEPKLREQSDHKLANAFAVIAGILHDIRVFQNFTLRGWTNGRLRKRLNSTRVNLSWPTAVRIAHRGRCGCLNIAVLTVNKDQLVS